MTCKIEYVEDRLIEATFADRLAVTQIGAMTHLCFIAASPTTTGNLEHTLKAHIVVPTAELKATIAAITAGQYGSAALVPFDVADAMVQ